MLAPAALTVLVVVFILATCWSPIRASNPAYLGTLVLAAGFGVAAIAFALVTPKDAPARQRSPAWVIIRKVLGLGLTVLVLAVLLWLRPLAATSVAVAAMQSGEGVQVTSTGSDITLRPDHGALPTGLIFYPGALVDPRAYVPLLRAVALAGFPVDIIKPPYGIAFLASNAPATVISANPGVTRWVVGGHSLGGVAASSFVSPRRPGVDGLLLWASYPASSIRQATWLHVSSISAGNDGLATPAKIEASKPDLPADTTFVVVHGAVHADFGDYGTQRGDGTPTVSRAKAQSEIEAASVALLRKVNDARG